MKKWIAILLCTAMLFGCLTGCGAQKPAQKKLSIVATIFPEYDWVMQILGERAKDADVTLLLDSGVDLHSFQPTAKDIITISNCDVFIYVGGESDEWVEDALAEAVNKNMVVVNLLEALGEDVKEEEIVPGMEAEEEEEGEEEPEYDEHVWLSLRNTAKLCWNIRDALIAVDPDGKEVYSTNANAYIAKLNALDQKYQSTVDAAPVKTLLFGDRFPFRYMADDYSISYYAAFVGCSAETEASFETIAFLANKVSELGLNHVMTLEGSDGKIAQTIISTAGSNADILSMDSMQSCTMKDVKAGATYLSIMEKNLEVLTQALK